MTKKGLVIIILVAIVIIAGVIFFMNKGPANLEKASGTDTGQGTVAGGGSIVSIKNLKFNPSTVNIRVNETVTWRNDDSVLHDITIDNGLFDHDLEPGEAFSYVFNESGTYDYHCDIHTSMKGRVVVQ